MILADLSIKRPVFITVIVAALVIVGILCYTSLTINNVPQTDLPYVTVTINENGASPAQLEANITKKVEDVVGQISGVKHISSTMTLGVSNTAVEFDMDKSPYLAVQEVKDKVASIRGELPQDIDEPVISRYDFLASPVLSIAVTGKEELKELSWLVDEVIAKKLYTIKGVGTVNIYGNTERQIQIKLRKEKLAAYGLTVQEVVNSLKSVNLEGLGGAVSNKNNEISLQIDNRVQRVTDFNDIVVARRNGVNIRVADIAEVIDGAKENSSLSFFQGKQAVGIDVIKQSGANTVQVVDGVKKELTNLKELIPEGVNVNIVQDNSVGIRNSVNDVVKSILEGCLLAILVVFLFLNEWQSTLITAITLPTVIISTFIALKVMNFSLNTMSLMALSLSIGLLVDDAIVVIENIVRHLHLGKTPVQAAKEATSEIGPAVLAATMTMVSVFLPTAMGKGFIGRYFFEFGLTVVFSVLCSLFMALTVVPMLASKLLKNRKKKRKGIFYQILNNFNQFFEKLAEKYSRFLAVVLQHRLITLSLVMVLFLASLTLLSLLGLQIDPKTDDNMLMVLADLDSGLALTKASQKAEEIEKIINKYSEVKSIYTKVEKEQISFVVNLLKKNDRKDSARLIASKMRQDLKKVPGIELAINAANDTDALKEVRISIEGDNNEALRSFAFKAKKLMSQDPHARDVSFNYKPGKPQMKLLIDNDKAADLGVNTVSVINTLHSLFEGINVGKYKTEEDSYDVRVSMQGKQQSNLASLNGLYVPGSNNQMVPLDQVTKKVFTTTDATLNRYDRNRQIELSANVTGIAADDFLNEYLNKFKNEMMVPAGISIKAGGMNATMQEGFMGLVIALAMGVLFIFMVMAAQFESFLDPLAIMFSLPLALIGAIVGLYLTGSTMGFTALIGIIMLMGLVVKTAILLIDFTIQRMKEGMGINEALIEAGQVRFRPILMTTLSTIFGMVPVALATGAGSEMRVPMAYAVIGGLFSSTLLTLFIIPVVYTLLHDLKGLFKKVISWEASKKSV